jgi:hypothetical protein
MPMLGLTVTLGAGIGASGVIIDGGAGGPVAEVGGVWAAAGGAFCRICGGASETGGRRDSCDAATGVAWAGATGAACGAIGAAGCGSG